MKRLHNSTFLFYSTQHKLKKHVLLIREILTKPYYLQNSSLQLWTLPVRLLHQVKVHLVINVFSLWVEPLQDLCQDIDGLLAAQPRALCLELLQEVFSGHRFPD